MSTIGSLLLAMDPGIRPWSQGMQDVNREVIGRQQAQTGLIELQRLKESQAAEAELMRAAQTDPRVQAMLFGGSTLASLPTTGGPPAVPGAGAMTQQPFGPGGVGQAQTVPGGQDLSRFATQGGPPQSTLASLGPQPPGGMPGPPQNPVLEMARRDPRAAMMLQERQIKAFTTQLSMREKTAEAFASKLQGVNSQESYETAVQDLMQWAPQQAARLPKVWSKEAMQPIIASALSAKDSATLQIQDLEARTKAGTLGLAQQKALREQANVPNFTGDPHIDAAIYTRLQGRDFSTLAAPERAALVAEATKDVQTGKTTVAERTGAAQEALKPLGETQLLRFNTLTQAEDTITKLTTEFTQEERAKFVGAGGMTMGAQQLQQLWADVRGGKADPKFARFAALVALAKAEAFSTAGKALTETESGVVYGYIPTGKEYSAEEFEQKLKLAQERVPSMLDRELKLATTPRSELPGMRARGELGASTSKPTTTGSTAPQGNTFTDADIAATLANPANKGKTRQQVIDAALAKGLVYKER